jgi:hypothetical protein
MNYQNTINKPEYFGTLWKKFEKIIWENFYMSEYFFQMIQ